MSSILILFNKGTYSAVSQLLTANFFQNPAELSQIKRLQLVMGNMFIIPSLEFTGETPLGTGTVTSHVNDALPYLLTTARPTERLVVGFNITPSAYWSYRLASSRFYCFTSLNDNQNPLLPDWRSRELSINR